MEKTNISIEKFKQTDYSEKLVDVKIKANGYTWSGLLIRDDKTEVQFGKDKLIQSNSTNELHKH